MTSPHRDDCFNSNCAHTRCDNGCETTSFLLDARTSAASTVEEKQNPLPPDSEIEPDFSKGKATAEEQQTFLFIDAYGRNHTFPIMGGVRPDVSRQF